MALGRRRSGGVCRDAPSIPTRPIKGGVCCEAGSRMTLLAIASHTFAIALGIVPTPTGLNSDRYDDETRTGCKSPRMGRHHRVVVVVHLRAVVYRGLLLCEIAGLQCAQLLCEG